MADSTAMASAVDRCLETLRHRPCAIFSDFDGTISLLAPTPDAAVIFPVAEAALRRLQTAVDMVTVVTGRSAEVAQRMVGLPDLLYIGNHGLERRRGEVQTEHPAGLAASGGVTAALIEIGETVRGFFAADGLVFEDKRLSGSIHYRLVDDPVQARDLLLAAAHSAAGRHDLLVTEGRRIVELRPRAQVNKGTAILDEIGAHGLRGVLFLGDDVTDIDGFRALRAYREEAGIAALSIGVASPESPPALFETSDIIVEGVAACAQLLDAIADRLVPASA